MSPNNNPCFNLTHIYYGAFCGNFYTGPWRGFGDDDDGDDDAVASVVKKSFVDNFQIVKGQLCAVEQVLRPALLLSNAHCLGISNRGRKRGNLKPKEIQLVH